AVYRNNVVISLIDALADTFPVVQQLVGEDFFHAMAREHARKHPPTSPVLAFYGQDFPEFIASFEAAASLPYLADIARLEWAYVCAFHAADALPLPTQALAERLSQPERLAITRLRFAPAVRLIRSNHAVVSIWHAHQLADEGAAIDPACAESALVVRPELTVQIVPLSELAADFLSELIAGQSLGAAYEKCATHGDLDMAEIFSLLLQTGALTALESTEI
ncbi:MAG: putative DNA-binding domain-containing protein, partial [Betaproteobacteria bacterium]|nr:putative DNA-binding domain-containing protein [Betaproteobacteria bacterium]